MSSLTCRMKIYFPWMRAVTVAALSGAALLVNPPGAVRAAEQVVVAQNTAAQKPPAAAAATSQQPETVEQRITQLRAALKITPDEETRWNLVAQTMRENASHMEKLVTEKRQKSAQEMTAVDDLETYRQFAEAHLEGLKNLTSAFKSLYDSMPDAQKKNADQVFQDYGRAG